MDSFEVFAWIFRGIFYLFIAFIAFIIVKENNKKRAQGRLTKQQEPGRGGPRSAINKQGKKASLVTSGRQPSQHPATQTTKVFFILLSWFALPPILLLMFFIGAGITLVVFGENAPIVAGGFVFMAGTGISAMLLFRKRLLHILGIKKQHDQ